MALTAQTNGKEWGCDTALMFGAASVTRENIKAAPGTIFSISVSNINATVYYLQLFNRITAPSASDATDLVDVIPIPANTAVGGREVSVPVKGIGFPDGIAMKICAGQAGNDNTNGNTGVTVTIRYK